MQARAYTPSDAAQWDAFCAASPCATFLHTRRFLSYHGERFVDRSLILHDEGQWLGVIAAAQHPSEPTQVVSHPGITYGGLVHQGGLRGGRAIEALQAAAAHWAEQGYQRLLYKALPSIYQQAPAQDDLYALFRLGALRTRCDLSCSIDLRASGPRTHPFSESQLQMPSQLPGQLSDQPLATPCATLTTNWPRSERRQRGIKKAAKASLHFAQGLELAPALWAVLQANLASRHGAKPVHTLAEITLLAERFPQHIGFHGALLGKELLAGVVSFSHGGVVHAQYIAASEVGQAACALDGLFDHLITQARKQGARIFDFGICNEDQGRVLNEGLYRFKSEFGGGGTVHEFYTLGLSPIAAAPS